MSTNVRAGQVLYRCAIEFPGAKSHHIIESMSPICSSPLKGRKSFQCVNHFAKSSFDRIHDSHELNSKHFHANRCNQLLSDEGLKFFVDRLFKMDVTLIDNIWIELKIDTMYIKRIFIFTPRITFCCMESAIQWWIDIYGLQIHLILTKESCLDDEFRPEIHATMYHVRPRLWSLCFVRILGSLFVNSWIDVNCRLRIRSSLTWIDATLCLFHDFDTLWCIISAHIQIFQNIDLRSGVVQLMVCRLPGDACPNLCENYVRSQSLWYELKQWYVKC
jgi:hypothetical protein